jgi:hypothetical protein
VAVATVSVVDASAEESASVVSVEAVEVSVEVVAVGSAVVAVVAELADVERSRFWNLTSARSASLWSWTRRPA